MDKITENANNLAKELITTADAQSYIQVVNPTTGKVDNMKISDLASVVAGMFNPSSSIMKDYGGAPGSCNDYTENGIRFVYGGSALDYPLDNPYGILKTYKTYYPALKSTYINQIFIIYDNKGIYTRFKDGGNDWTDWVRADNFGYNSLEELADALKPLMQ